MRNINDGSHAVWAYPLWGLALACEYNIFGHPFLKPLEAR